MVPAIWITNTVTGVDPAYLRRFDIVQEVVSPLPAVKKRIARRMFKDLPLDDTLIDHIVENKSITPAHLQKVNKICRRLGVETKRETKAVVNQILSGDLKAIYARPLKIDPESGQGPADAGLSPRSHQLRYRCRKAGRAHASRQQCADVSIRTARHR